VNLRVRSNPAGAKVTRADTGEVLGVTPLTRDVVRLNTPVMFRVELAGHETLEKSVPLSSNVTLDVALGPSKHRALGSRPVANKRGGERFSRDAVVDPFAL
jgi:serine/threonine-protein kinase